MRRWSLSSPADNAPRAGEGIFAKLNHLVTRGKRGEIKAQVSAGKKANYTSLDTHFCVNNLVNLAVVFA